ncbi:MAG: tetratricopeptide repeat protein, partial [bacterium]|nr:tetratricopeptide repeat protein [bacterium]
DHPLALSNISSLYSTIGKYEKAAEYARRAIKSYKESPIPQNTLGLYYARKGDSNTALDYFLAAFSSDESYLVAAYNAACAYTDLNQSENALKYLELAFTDERYIAEASNGRDLDRLRELPEFKALILDGYDRHNIGVE